jgi:hypothetical protein
MRETSTTFSTIWASSHMILTLTAW